MPHIALIISDRVNHAGVLIYMIKRYMTGIIHKDDNFMIIKL